MVTITSKRPGFRRCGVAHPDKATEYADDRFTADELKQLQSEPMLTVVVGDGAGKAVKKAAGKKEEDPGKKEEDPGKKE